MSGCLLFPICGSMDGNGMILPTNFHHRNAKLNVGNCVSFTGNVSAVDPLDLPTVADSWSTTTPMVSGSHVAIPNDSRDS